MSRLLTRSDIIFALGYNPYDAGNPGGYVDLAFFSANLPALAAPKASPHFTGPWQFDDSGVILGSVDLQSGLLTLSSQSAILTLGKAGAASTPLLRFLANAAGGVLFDAEIEVTGGVSGADGKGIVNLRCNGFTINGVSVATGTAAMGTVLPLAAAVTALVGISTSYAREDHVHPHPVAPVFGANGSSTASVAINGAAGTLRTLKLRTAGLDRWQLYANATAEGGSNAGSDLALDRYNDAGNSALGTVLTVKRSNGHILIGSPITDDPNGGVLQVAGSTRLSLNASAAQTAPANTPLQVVGLGGSPARALTDGYGSYGAFSGRRANGSSTAPSALASGDVIAALHGWGYGATSYSASYRGAVNVLAGAAWTDSDQSTTISFETTPSGSTTPATRMRIMPSGRVLLNTSVDDGAAQLQVQGLARINGSTLNTIVAAPPTGTLLHASGNPSAATYAVLDLINTGTGGFAMRRANGTAAAPTNVINAQNLVSLQAWGYGATGYGAAQRGELRFVSGADWSDTDQSAYLSVFTTPTGSTVTAERVRVTPSGRVIVQPAGGTFTDDGANALQVSGTTKTADLLLNTDASQSAVSGAWSTYTPTVGSTSGTIGANTPTGRYKKIGRLVFVQIQVTITAIGTAAGQLTISLPFTTAAPGYSIAGRDAATNKALSSHSNASSTTLNVTNYDNTMPTTGASLVLTGLYEAAS